MFASLRIHSMHCRSFPKLFKFSLVHPIYLCPQTFSRVDYNPMVRIPRARPIPWAHSFLLAPTWLTMGCFPLMAMSFSRSGGSSILTCYELKLSHTLHASVVSFICFLLSILAAIARLISGGAIPLDIRTLSIGVGFFFLASCYQTLYPLSSYGMTFATLGTRIPQCSYYFWVSTPSRFH